jgi:hypothetical protein
MIELRPTKMLEMLSAGVAGEIGENKLLITCLFSKIYNAEGGAIAHIQRRRPS